MLDFTVLLIETDSSFRLFLRLALEVVGAAVIEAADMVAGLRSAYESNPDVAVIGVSESGAGTDAVERLRELSALPIVAVGVVADRQALIAAREAGADVYVTRSAPAERVAERVLALVPRTAAGRPGGVAPRRAYGDDRLRVDFSSVEVRVDGRRVSLTPLEYRVLECLVRRPGAVLSADELAHEAWRGEPGGPERVKPHIGGLRKKLGGLAPRVMTIRGKGYTYRPFDR